MCSHSRAPIWSSSRWRTCAGAGALHQAGASHIARGGAPRGVTFTPPARAVRPMTSSPSLQPARPSLVPCAVLVESKATGWYRERRCAHATRWISRASLGLPRRACRHGSTGRSQRPSAFDDVDQADKEIEGAKSAAGRPPYPCRCPWARATGAGATRRPAAHTLTTASTRRASTGRGRGACATALQARRGACASRTRDRRWRGRGGDPPPLTRGMRSASPSSGRAFAPAKTGASQCLTCRSQRSTCASSRAKSATP